MILRDSLLRRNIAEDSTLLFVVASHVYKDDAGAFFVTAESAFFRNLLDKVVNGISKSYDESTIVWPTEAGYAGQTNGGDEPFRYRPISARKGTSAQ